MKRVFSAALGLLLLLIPLYALSLGGAQGYVPSVELDAPGASLVNDMERHLKDFFPLQQPLKELGLTIRALGGQQEYGGVFISGEELIPDLDPPMEYYIQENTASIVQFAEALEIPTFCMIIPTAAAIRQEHLPQFTQTQVVNQKQIIEDVYSNMIGKVTVADAYTTLFNARDQYLYYRTHNNLTSLGGYYLYTVLGSKMLGLKASLDDYDIEYVKTDFYGDLYTDSPFKDARADTISVFRYVRNPREYLVTKRKDGNLLTYHTLFPLHLQELRPLDVYLGGVTALTRIDTNAQAPYRTRLLVFGDKTAISYLPFLANHYASVTWVDLFYLDAEGYASINLREFDQALFAYGIESFIHTNNPARAIQLMEYLDEDDFNYFFDEEAPPLAQPLPDGWEAPEEQEEPLGE